MLRRIIEVPKGCGQNFNTLYARYKVGKKISNWKHGAPFSNNEETWRYAFMFPKYVTNTPDKAYVQFANADGSASTRWVPYTYIDFTDYTTKGEID